MCNTRDNVARSHATMQFVCVAELRVPINYTTMVLWQMHAAGSNANYTYQFLKEIIFHLIYTLPTNAALKQKNVSSLMAFFKRIIWLNRS
jgi:hypothetical protein